MQDIWFDETDNSADDSEGSPVARPQSWKVHQGLASDDVHLEPHGIMNAAFIADSNASRPQQVAFRQFAGRDDDEDVPDFL